MLALAALVAAVACVQTNATMLNPAPANHPRTPADKIRIYRTADQVKAKYDEVALLNSTGESNWTDEAKMMESMRKKASEVGANAIILDAINEASAGAKVAAAVFGTGTQRKGRSIAIYVYPDSTR
ncbi:MAG TPA: hypothetical protein VG916_01430 [Gemmatimonadaceae bacterium]|nr:hypothetical protein [Gemmatimonadaceae bacterium]